jgi:redox-sensitive bicupin YhaK (pirin superfamily)
MVQLWVNLPARLKMSPPRYQDLTSAQIPVVTLPDGAGRARVIAGELQGARGPAQTFTPVHLWDLRLNAGGRTTLEVPAGFNTLMLVLAGRVKVLAPVPDPCATLPEGEGIQVNGEEAVDAGELAVFGREGRAIVLEAAGDATVLVMSGEPIDEPVVGYGPFVMNTSEEIRQALRDYQSGEMGMLES